MIPEKLHSEIAELEAKLAAKKQEATHEGSEVPEQEVFQTVFKEHAGTSEQQSVSNPPQNSTAPSGTEPRALTEEEKSQIHTLIEHSFTKGIAFAISEAQKTHDPFFIDSLHDQLADTYYEKLIQTRKLKQL